MKLRVLGALFLGFALMTWVGCGGGDGTSTPGDDVITPQPDATGNDTTPQPDTGTDTTPQPDTGTDTTVQPDQVQTENPPTDTPQEACTPACDGKVCGPNGCGGNCGECDEGTHCSDDQSTCEQGACQNPTTWGPVGAIATAEIPSAATGCPNNVNDLGLVASFANPELKKAIDEGKFGILLEFQGVTDFANTASFTLAGLLGEPEAAGSANFLIDSKSYKADDCQPLISFADAAISGGALAAGPSEFYLNLPIEQLGGNLEMTLKMAEITASITDGTVAATNGFIGGYALKKDIDVVLQAVQETQCNVTPKPDWCGYLSMIDMLYKDYDIDGETQKAMAVCLKFTLAGATVAGYKPAD